MDIVVIVKANIGVVVIKAHCDIFHDTFVESYYGMVEIVVVNFFMVVSDFDFDIMVDIVGLDWILAQCCYST